MAFYDKAPSRYPKKRDFASEGKWEEAGRSYSGNAGSRRFGPSSAQDSDRPRRGTHHDGRSFQHNNDRSDFQHGQRRFDKPYGDRQERGDRFHEDRSERRDFHHDSRPRDRKPFREERREFHGRPERELAPRQPSYLDNEFRPSVTAPVMEEEHPSPTRTCWPAATPSVRRSSLVVTLRSCLYSAAS